MNLNETPHFTFTFDIDPGIDLNNAVKIVVGIGVNTRRILRYKYPTDAAYDGDVTIDPIDVTKCSVAVSPDDAKKLSVGSMYAEIHLEIPHTDYPDGLVVDKRIRVDQIEDTYLPEE